MKHIRPVTVMKANLLVPVSDLYFSVLRAYEDLKLLLKFEPFSGNFDLINFNNLPDLINTGGNGDDA